MVSASLSTVALPTAVITVKVLELTSGHVVPLGSCRVRDSISLGASLMGMFGKCIRVDGQFIGAIEDKFSRLASGGFFGAGRGLSGQGGMVGGLAGFVVGKRVMN